MGELVMNPQWAGSAGDSLRPKADGRHNSPKRSLDHNLAYSQSESALKNPGPSHSQPIVYLTEACRISRNLYAWILNSPAPANLGCKQLLGEACFQKIPHDPTYPAGFAR